ncbi:MAG: hypothetical protein MI974_25480 [Chitinophagales bacterium]|nr:hypothetical protein [Chitinophagales bacterium]
MERYYRNIGLVFIVLLPITFIAFFSSYFIHFPRFSEEVTPLIHLHATMALLWIIVLIVQPLLLRYGKRRLHHLIGKLSYIFFPLLIISTVPLLGEILQSDFARFASIPIGELFLLTACYLLAMYYRKKPALHMRYMIGTSLTFLGPTLGRILPLFLLSWTSLQRENLKTILIEIIIVLLIFYDKKTKGNYKPYRVILIAWLIHHLCYNLAISEW